MHKSGDNTSSVWPAYVAVMACLIQIMMLLVVVLATGVMTMSSQTSSLKAAIAQLFLDQQLQMQAVLNADGSQNPTPNRTGEEAAQTAQLVAVSALMFQSEALKLDNTAKQNLARFVNDQAKGAHLQWEIVTQGPQLANSTDRRAAFLRLLEVRQVLLEAGIKEQRILTKIEDRGTSELQKVGETNTVSVYVRRGQVSPEPSR